MPTESPITSRARVILVLAAHGPLGPTEVQRRAGMANTAQVLLDGLEKAGMVESAPSPPGTKGRPGRVWSLTPRGHQEARDIRGALLVAWGGGEVPMVSMVLQPQEPSQPENPGSDPLAHPAPRATPGPPWTPARTGPPITPPTPSTSDPA